MLWKENAEEWVNWKQSLKLRYKNKLKWKNAHPNEQLHNVCCKAFAYTGCVRSYYLWSSLIICTFSDS